MLGVTTQSGYPALILIVAVSLMYLWTAERALPFRMCYKPNVPLSGNFEH
jgi:hypothetical protein